MNKHDRRFDRAREALQEGSAMAKASTHATGNGYFAAAEAVREFNMKLIEIAQKKHDGNAQLCAASCDCESLPEAAALWSSCARQSFETWTDQSRELTALAQRVVQLPGR
jgi:hypothetical protein